MSHTYAGDPAIFPAAATLPDDLVDQRSAASVNVPLEACLDRTAYLLARTVSLAGYMVAGAGNFTQTVSPSHSWAAVGSFNVLENLGILTVTGTQTDDLIVVHVGSSYIVSNPGYKTRLRIASSEDATTYTDAFAGVWIDPGLSERWGNLFSPGSELENDKQFALSTMVQIIGTTGHIRFAIQADVGNAANGVAIPNNAPLGGYYQVLRPVVP